MVEIFYVGGATCIINIDNCIKIGIDPALSSKGYKINFKSFVSIKKIQPNFIEGVFDNIDLWLITHTHEDHLDKEGIKKILPNSTVICESKKSFSKIKNGRCRVLKWGEVHSFNKENITVEITAIPAYHAQNFIVRKLIGKVNGYIVTIKNEKIETSIYFTGDTVYDKRIVKMISKPIDIMVANLGNARGDTLFGPLTMNIKMLEQFLETVCPNDIIPIHIDDYSHYNMTKMQVEKLGYKLIPSGRWIKLSAIFE